MESAAEGVRGYYCSEKTVSRIKLSAAPRFDRNHMWIHVVRPCAMVLAAVIGFSTLSISRWRLLVAALQAAFVLFDMIVLPVARKHATLYTNLFIALSLLISSVSPSNAWPLHAGAFISAHMLLVGYILGRNTAGGFQSQAACSSILSHAAVCSFVVMHS